MQALGPLNRNLVAFWRRDQAERGLLRQRTVPLPVEVHLAAELAVAAGILAGHVVDGVGGAGLDRLVVVAGLHHRDEAVALLRIGVGREEQRLASRRRERVPQGSEYEEEEDDDDGEERRRDQVQEPPLPSATLRRRQVQVPHFPISPDHHQMSIQVSTLCTEGTP